MHDKVTQKQCADVMGVLETGSGLRAACKSAGIGLWHFRKHIWQFYPRYVDRVAELLEARRKRLERAWRQSPEGRASVNAQERARYALAHPGVMPKKSLELDAFMPRPDEGNETCSVCGKKFFTTHKRTVCGAECFEERKRRYRQTPEGRAKTNAAERARYLKRHPGCRMRYRQCDSLFDGDGAGI